MARPSRCAAIARMAPAVTMPPPPMPANKPRQTLPERAETGCGKRRGQLTLTQFPGHIGGGSDRRPRQGHETGQNPFRHDKSTLQLLWVDPSLAAKRSFHRFDCDTTGLRRAITAIFAHRFIYHDTAGPAEPSVTPLAAAALLGGANLVVNQNGWTFEIRAVDRCTASRSARIWVVTCAILLDGNADLGGSRSASSATMAMRLIPSAAICAASIGDGRSCLRRAARRSSRPRRCRGACR